MLLVFRRAAPSQVPTCTTSVYWRRQLTTVSSRPLPVIRTLKSISVWTKATIQKTYGNWWKLSISTPHTSVHGARSNANSTKTRANVRVAGWSREHTRGSIEFERFAFDGKRRSKTTSPHSIWSAHKTHSEERTFSERLLVVLSRFFERVIITVEVNHVTGS